MARGLCVGKSPVGAAQVIVAGPVEESTSFGLCTDPIPKRDFTTQTGQASLLTFP